MTCSEHKGAYGSNSRDNFGLEFKCKKHDNIRVGSSHVYRYKHDSGEQNRLRDERENFKNE